MSQKHGHARVVAKSATKVVKNGAKKADSALALVANRLHAGRRAVKHAGATVSGLSRRAKRVVKSHPLRVLLCASAAGFVLAKLKLGA
ncbi:MAG TPA: hypothetical protein VHO06_10060 [Polyangia bacterium]|nr:hypothetical protein [Polyangia bacterium]